MRRLPPLGAIQAFVHVARLGSVKAAADALALSPPALTRRIQNLEQHLGLSLFERQHNSLRLNAEGERFLAEVAPHIEALAAVVDRVGGHARPTPTRVRIAVPSLFASQRLVPAAARFQQRHPDISVEFDTAPNRLGRLGEELDAAIVITDRVEDRFYSRLIEGGRIAAIGARSLQDGANPIRSVADLAQRPILLHRDLPGAFRAWRDGVGHPEIEPASTTSFDAGQLILDAAAAGMGVAFMLAAHLSSSSDPRLVQLLEDTVPSPYSYWFACQPAALKRRPVKVFHDWLFDTFAAEVTGS